MDFIDEKLRAYAQNHTTPEQDILKELTEDAGRELEYLDMLSGPVIAQLLRLLIQLSGSRRVLEIGTFAGYSALAMAEALPDDGELITCELNERYGELARKFFKKSKSGHKIKLMMGEALDTLKSLEGPFDLVFIDADKQNYPSYYREVFPRVRRGGLIIIDNVLWSGEVLNPDNDKARAIDRLNKTIAADDRVEQVMLTERDGLIIARKI